MTGYLSGKVVDTDNDPIANATVEASSNGSTVGSTTTDTDGFYVIELPTGTYKVTVSKAGYFTAQKSGVTIETNKTTEEDFTLTNRPYKILGQGTDSDEIGVLGLGLGGGTPIGVKGAVPGTSGYGLATPDNARIEGTIDTNETDFVVNAGTTATSDATNVIMGHAKNSAASGVVGAVIGGGGYEDGSYVLRNTVTGDYGIVAGGRDNTAGPREDATVGGGMFNEARARGATVGGGNNNTASAISATISGGENNTATSGSDNATVGGGHSNVVKGYSTTVAGGGGNTAGGVGDFIGGGTGNTTRGRRAIVAGGFDNTAKNVYATVGGGKQNTASGAEVTICGGSNNTASAKDATVGGGDGNTASGRRSTVAGGQSNVAKGSHATVPGGSNNTASGDYSFATGRNASTSGYEGAFVVGNSSGTPITAQGSNEARFQLDLYAKTTNETSARAAKTDIEPVDPPSVLSGVESLEVATWRFEEDEPGDRHMGPMAEEFHETFGLGSDPGTIASVDRDGVALAAIQGLSERLDEKDKQIESLQIQIDTLEIENEELRTQLARKDEQITTLENRLAAVESHLGLGDAPPTPADD